MVHVTIDSLGIPISSTTMINESTPFVATPILEQPLEVQRLPSQETRKEIPPPPTTNDQHNCDHIYSISSYVGEISSVVFSSFSSAKINSIIIELRS